jgi:transposase
MPAKRELTMRQIRQMLRLARDGVSAREIGRTLGVAGSTIQDNLKRAAAAGLAWPLPGELTDATLEQRLFAHAGVKRGFRRRVEPDWAALACELKRPGVNLMVLWEEYRAVYPSGYAYSRFCDLFREFERRLSPTMRQDHPAGDKVFVDYSGKRITIVDRQTGAVREAEIFVAVLGASNYTYAEATWTQTLPDWIEAHVRMFRFFDGVPRLVVPDNLKSGVKRASFYDPELNRSYGMMASHYGVGILPARPPRPQRLSHRTQGREPTEEEAIGWRPIRNLTFQTRDNIITRDPCETTPGWPASNRNPRPASNWNAWPASSEPAPNYSPAAFSKASTQSRHSAPWGGCWSSVVTGRTYR